MKPTNSLKSQVKQYFSTHNLKVCKQQPSPIFSDCDWGTSQAAVQFSPGYILRRLSHWQIVKMAVPMVFLIWKLPGRLLFLCVEQKPYSQQGTHLPWVLVKRPVDGTSIGAICNFKKLKLFICPSCACVMRYTVFNSKCLTM